MVLTKDEYQEEKSNPTLSSLFKLRNATTSYIIQCLADREIQNAVNDQQQRSKAFRYNCEVIHSPDIYFDVSMYSLVAFIFILYWSIGNFAASRSCKKKI